MHPAAVYYRYSTKQRLTRACRIENAPTDDRLDHLSTASDDASEELPLEPAPLPLGAVRLAPTVAEDGQPGVAYRARVPNKLL